MRALKWILLGLAVVVVGLVVVALTIDVNRFKPQIVAAVEEATGRRLDIAGDLKLTFMPMPAVAVEGVTFANASWGSRPAMATVGEFAAEIDLFALIGSQIKVNRLVLADVDVLLEKNRQGQANWEFAEKTVQQQAQPAQQPATDASGGGMGALPEISNVQLKNIRLAYNDAQTGASNLVNLTELSVRQASGGMLAAKLVANVDGNDIEAEGTLGSLAELAAPSRPWPVKMTLTLPGAKATVDGSIAQPMQAKGIALKVSADVPDLAAVANRFGAPAPAVPLTLQTEVKETGAQRYSLAALSGKIGDSDFAGSGGIALGGARPSLNLTLASQLMDLVPLLEMKQPDGSPAAAPPASGQASGGSGAGQPADGRLFSNEPLPFDGLTAADATVSYKAASFRAPKIEMQNLAVALTLKDGVLTVKPQGEGIAGGSFRGDVTLNGKAKSLAAKLDAKGIVISEYLQKQEITDVVRRGGPTDVSVDITSRGESLRQIMAGMNGKAMLSVGEGELKQEYIRQFLPRLAQAAGIFDRATAKTKLHCVVTGLDIRNGVATPKALLAETGSLTVAGDGNVNLGTEQLDLRIIPSSRDSSLSAAMPPIRVRGQFASPSFVPDPAAMVKGVLGAAAGAAVLGPIGVLGPLLGGSSGGDPDEEAKKACARALALAEGRPLPKEEGSSAQPQQQPSSNPIDQLQKGLGGLLRR